MKTNITIEDILKLMYYNLDYNTADELKETTGGRESLTPLEVLDLDITAKDKLWVLLRPEIVPVKELQLLACDFAEHVLHIFEEEYPDDSSPRNLIKATRDYIAGNIELDTLSKYRNEAFNTSYAATIRDGDYASYAVVDAAIEASWADYNAVNAADCANVAAHVAAVVPAVVPAEHEWQLEQVREVLMRLEEI